MSAETNAIITAADAAIAQLNAIKVQAVAISTWVPPGSPPPPPSGGAITYPQNNDVFHRGKTTGTVSFTATKSGGGDSFRIMQGTTVVQTSASGAFTNVPMGKYTLELLDGATVLHTVKFGVGYKYMIYGQSNARAARETDGTGSNPLVYVEPQAYGTVAGQAIIGVLNADGTGVTYMDSFDTDVPVGLTSVYMMNKLRTMTLTPDPDYVLPNANRDVPYCVVVCGQSATPLQSFAVAPLLTLLTNALTLTKPGAVIMYQGESNAETDATPLVQAFQTIYPAANAAHQVPWIVNLCDHAHTNPAGTYWAIALAQQWFVETYADVHWGIDCSVMHSPASLPYSINRQHAEIHPYGPRRVLTGELQAQRIFDLRNLGI